MAEALDNTLDTARTADPSGAAKDFTAQVAVLQQALQTAVSVARHIIKEEEL